MKIWKIEHTNKTMDGAKIAVSISSSESRGFILKPGEFVLCQEQLTASIDSMARRGFIKYESFDNFNLNLNLGEVYSIALLNVVTPAPVIENVVEHNQTEEPSSNEITLNKLEEAEKDASDYINQKED